MKHALQLQSCDAGSTYTKFKAALQRQAALRDDINRTNAQETGLEQLLTVAVVTLSQPSYRCPHAAGDRDNYTEKKVEEMVSSLHNIHM